MPYGKKFPNSDKMLGCVARLREAFALARTGRYLPILFWFSRSSEDSSGILEIEFRDEFDNTVILYGPQLTDFLPPLGITKPRLIAPGNLIGRANSQILFSVQEANNYTEYWKDYPRKPTFRKIKNMSKDTTQIMEDRDICH